VREGISGQSCNCRQGISQPSHLLLWQFFQLMVTAHTYPTLQLSDAVPWLANLVENESWGHVRKSPTLWKSPPLPYTHTLYTWYILCMSFVLAVLNVVSQTTVSRLSVCHEVCKSSDTTCECLQVGYMERLCRISSMFKMAHNRHY